MDGATLLSFLDPTAGLLVAGGAFAVAALRASRAELKAAFAALPALFTARPDEDADAAIRAVRRVEAIAQAKGLICVDRIQTTAPFLRLAVAQLSDARSVEGFQHWAEDMLDGRRRRHQGAIALWRSVADAAPAMGLIGTVIGLVRMFASMADPSRIGAPMALALLATLYGIIVANLIAGPIADRLERLSEAELAWQERALDHFAGLARAELGHVRPFPRAA